MEIKLKWNVFPRWAPRSFLICLKPQLRKNTAQIDFLNGLANEQKR